MCRVCGHEQQKQPKQLSEVQIVNNVDPQVAHTNNNVTKV